jgi:ribA/ribD-fused uncharacterized protein
MMTSPTDYIQLDMIRVAFARYFEGFGIELPLQVQTWEDISHASGWSITYALGRTADGLPCLYVAAVHRMTNPRHFLIREDGQIDSLDFYQEGFAYDPEVPGDHEVQQQRYFRHNQTVSALHRLNGLGGNFEFNVRAQVDAQEAHEAGEGFHFFWETASPFSQWHRCSFEAFGLQFNTAEQYMMHQKALLFGDHAIAAQILTTTNPRAQKGLGRQIANFDERIWKDNCRRIVYAANAHKFLQNEALLQALLATEEQLLVEASPDDAIWGIGLAADDPRAHNMATWLGTNWLGGMLTLLRDDIRLKLK